MPVPLSSLIPDAVDLLALEVEELAGVLLVHLNSLGDNSGDGVASRGRISHQNFFAALESRLGYEPEYGSRQAEVNLALMEEWSWLQGEGFLVRAADQPLDWFFLSRRARRLRSREEFEAA